MKAPLVASLFAVAQAALLREAVQQQLASSDNPNNNAPICYEIFEQQWWKERKDPNVAVGVSVMDSYCAPFSGQANNETCNSASARNAQYDSMGADAFNAMYYGGTATSQDITNSLDAACTMIGAHNGQCIGNPCNSLNEGSCQLSDTQGMCVWWTKENVQEINNYRNANTDTAWGGSIPGFGCYRNPCNIPGTGTQSNSTCQPYSVPSLFQCTYCISKKDPVLAGQGMGCQMMQVQSANALSCATVRLDANVPAGSVYQRVTNLTCQCSNRFGFCNKLLTDPDTRSNFQPLR